MPNLEVLRYRLHLFPKLPPLKLEYANALFMQKRLQHFGDPTFLLAFCQPTPTMCSHVFATGVNRWVEMGGGRGELCSVSQSQCTQGYEYLGMSCEICPRRNHLASLSSYATWVLLNNCHRPSWTYKHSCCIYFWCWPCLMMHVHTEWPALMHVHPTMWLIQHRKVCIYLCTIIIAAYVSPA